MSMTTPRVTVPVELVREEIAKLIDPEAFVPMEDVIGMREAFVLADKIIAHTGYDGINWKAEWEAVCSLRIAERDTLSAAPAPEGGAVDGWRPIDSAPQDGTKIDLWGHWPEHDRWTRTPDAVWDEERCDWKVNGFYAGQYAHPPHFTHWRAISGPAALACKNCGGKGYTEHEGGEGEGYPSRPETEACACREEAPAEAKRCCDRTTIGPWCDACKEAPAEAREDFTPVTGLWKDQSLSRLERVKAHRMEFRSDVCQAVKAVDEESSRQSLSALLAQPQARAWGWDYEICTGCSASLTAADIKAGGHVSCCPDRRMVTVRDLVDAYDAQRKPQAREDAQPVSCQSCGGEVQGWVCQGCGLTFCERDGRLVAEHPAPDALRAIEMLRASEGDSVTILCNNPEATDLDDAMAVVCCGQWTDWKDRRFYGRDVSDALSKALDALQAEQKGGAA